MGRQKNKWRKWGFKFDCALETRYWVRATNIKNKIKLEIQNWNEVSVQRVLLENSSMKNASATPTSGAKPPPVPLECHNHRPTGPHTPCLVWASRVKPFRVSADQSQPLSYFKHHARGLFSGLVPNGNWVGTQSPWLKLVLLSDSWACEKSRFQLRDLHPVFILAETWLRNSSLPHPWCCSNRGLAAISNACCIYIYLMHRDICLSYVARLISNFFLRPKARLKIPINVTCWKVL